VRWFAGRRGFGVKSTRPSGAGAFRAAAGACGARGGGRAAILTVWWLPLRAVWIRFFEN